MAIETIIPSLDLSETSACMVFAIEMVPPRVPAIHLLMIICRKVLLIPKHPTEIASPKLPATIIGFRPIFWERIPHGKTTKDEQ